MPVYGTPAAGLTNPTWIKGDTSTAIVGRSGEQRTAALLHRLGQTDVAVLHDLRIPGSRANIDHAVVAGRTITLIDSKVWRPGFYWSGPGGARRDLELFPPAKKATLTLAKSRIEQLLRERGVEARLATPVTLVWSSDGARPVRVWALRIDGTQVFPATAFDLRRLGRTAADARVVNTLLSLTRR